MPGFIDGPQIGRLKETHKIDVVIPIRSNMDILEDVRGLAKLGVDGTIYEPECRPTLTKDGGCGDASAERHPTVEKREARRQQTLAAKKAEQEKESPPDPSKVRERTYLARFDKLASWTATQRVPGRWR